MTLSTRLRIYRKAYKTLSEKMECQTDEGWPFYLCHKIPENNSRILDYPEFMIFKPIEYSFVWWTGYDGIVCNLERLTALGFMIAMCQYDINQNKRKKK